MRVFGVIGYKNSGKTTLCRALARQLILRGRTVGVIKCAHHALSIDAPGTDTYILAGSGAGTVAAISPETFMLIKKAVPPLLEALAFFTEDIVLVEGAGDDARLPVICCIDKRGMFPARGECFAYSGVNPDAAPGDMPAFDVSARLDELLDLALDKAVRI
jgi:molybdopterin-guanine dinucleotide biosynthesis protein B